MNFSVGLGRDDAEERLERSGVSRRDFMHQSDLVDTLISCQLVGKRPDTVVIGMEPLDFKSMAVDLTPLIASRLPAMCDIALKELRTLGGEATGKNDG